MSMNVGQWRAACAAVALTVGAALATDGTWSNASGGNWSDTAKWAGGNVASGAGASAYFTNGTGVTVFQDVGSLTLGNLYFANASTLITNNPIALNGGGTSVFTVNGSASTANVSVVLNPVAGTLLVKEGVGTLQLNKPAGASGAFGGIVLNAGTLLLDKGVGGDGLNVGTNSITINTGTVLRYLDNNLINNQSVIDVKSGGLLDFGNLSDNIGVLMGSGVVTNMSQPVQFWMGNTTRTFAGKCYGGGTLTFMQPGVFVVGASNSLENATFDQTFPGLLAFAPGIGTFMLGGLTGTNGLVLQDTLGGAITLGLGGLNNSVTYSMPFSGLGGIAKNGGGTITLTNAQAYAGATVVNNGTLKLGDGVNDGWLTNTASITVGTAGTLAFNTLASLTNSTPLYGPGKLTKALSSSVALNAFYMTNGAVTVNGGTFTLNGGGSTGATFAVNSGCAVGVNGGSLNGGGFTMNTGSRIAFNGGSNTGAALTVNGLMSAPVLITGGTNLFSNGIGNNHAVYQQTGGTSGFIGTDGNNNTNLIFVTVSGGTLRIGAAAWPRGLGLLACSNAAVTLTDNGSYGQRLASDGKGHIIIVTNSASITADSLLLMSSGTPASTGTLALAGGTFTVGNLNNGGANSNSLSAVNFNGGLFKSSANQSIGANAFSTFNVLEGGARIDSGAWTVSLQQPLLSGVGVTDGGLIKYGAGTLTLTTNATYTGQTIVKAGILASTALLDTPFGTGSLLADGGTLSVAPSGSGLTLSLTAAAGAAGNTVTYGAGPSALKLAKGSDTGVTLTLGNSGAAANSVLVRTNRGVLAISPGAGTAALGSTEKLLVNGGVTLVNSMASASLFAIHNDDRRSCDFLTYGGNGFQTASYTAGLGGGSASLANVTTNSIVSNTQVYALRVHNGANLTINGGNTLTVGDGVNPAGVIFNNSSGVTAGMTGGTLNFGSSEGVVIFNLRRSDQFGPNLNSVIAGSNGVTFSGGGSDEDISLGSAGNTYTGGTRIMAGRVSLANALGFSTGDVFIYGNAGWGGQFQFNFAGTVTNAFHLAGVGTTQGSTPAGAIRFDNNGTVSGSVELLDDTRVGTPTLSAVGTISGSIYGPFGFEIGCPGQAWGKVVLTGTNTYSGITRVSGGTLELSGGGTFGAGPVINNSTLSFRYAGNVTVTNPISGTGRVLQNGNGTLTLSGGNTCSGAAEVNAGTLVVKDPSVNASSVSVSGTLDLGGQSLTLGRLAGSGAVSNSAGGTVTLTVGAGNADGQFWGAIRNGTGTTALNKTGSGTLALSGLNTYSGATVIGGGTIKLQGVQTAAPTNGLAYQLDATDPSKLTLSGSNVTMWADSTAAGVNFTQSVAVLQPVYVTNALNGRSAVRFEGMTNCMGSGKATLVQTAFIVNRARGYMSGGGLWGQNNGDFGIRQASLTAWNHPGNGNDFSCGGQMFLNGVETNQLASNTPHILTAISASQKSWSTSVGDCRPYNGTLFRSYKGDVGEVLVYTNALAAADRQAVEAYLNYKWFGVGLLAPTNVLPTATALVVSNSAALDLNGLSQEVGSLSGAGSVANGSGVWSTLTVGNDNSSTLFSGVISGSNALVKVGGGTLTLGGANTYLGSTLISGGTLTLAGGANRLPTGSTVTVASGATLNLNGQAQTLSWIAGGGSVSGGSLTVTGTVAPGGLNAVGTLTLANTPVLSGSTLLIDTRTDGTCDKLAVTDALSLSGLTLQIADPTQMRGYSYEIVTCAGNLTGTFAAMPNLPSTWLVRYDRTLGAGRVLLIHNLGTLISIR